MYDSVIGLLCGGIIFGAILALCLSDLLIDLTRNKWRREAHYDCSECRVWDCPYHHCDYLRKKCKQP